MACRYKHLAEEKKHARRIVATTRLLYYNVCLFFFDFLLTLNLLFFQHLMMGPVLKNVSSNTNTSTLRFRHFAFLALIFFFEKNS